MSQSHSGQTKYINLIQAAIKVCRGLRFYTKIHLFSHSVMVLITYHGPKLAIARLFLAISVP